MRCAKQSSQNYFKEIKEFDENPENIGNQPGCTDNYCMC